MRYEVGDAVVVHKPKENPNRKDLASGWVSGMDKYDGKAGVITKVKPVKGSHIYEIDGFNGPNKKPYSFTQECLEGGKHE